MGYSGSGLEPQPDDRRAEFRYGRRPMLTPTSQSSEPQDRADAAPAPLHVELCREYRFESAHRLPLVPPGHRCARLHGHSYKVEIIIAGPVNEQTGWLIDFYEMDSIVTPLIEALDHRTLNDIEELENPTCERLCHWLWKRLCGPLPQIHMVTVWETVDARCSYRGEVAPGQKRHG